MNISILIAALVAVVFWLFYDDFSWEQTGYTSNPNLKTVKTDWKGTPVNKDGRFLNQEGRPMPSFGDLWKWQTQTNPQKEEKKNDSQRLKVIKNEDFLTSNQDCIVWFGHATFFIRMNGKTFLTDPVLGSPSFLMKRYSDLPVAVSLLKKLDYILVSHDHRDHCDEKSLKTLAPQNPTATYLTGLGLDKLLYDWTQSPSIQAAGWYQRYDTGTSPVEVVYVPSRHWGRRYTKDTNVRLWGGYIIKANGKTIYFGGDSGFGQHYEDIFKTFGPIDVAILGVGAYKPEWFMAQSHQSPAEAVKAAHILHAKKLIPMHYGTFDLADEPLCDPYRVLEKTKQLPENQSLIHLASVGEVVAF